MKKWEFGYERDYSHKQLVNLFFKANLVPIESVGLMILPPLATNNREMLSENLRKKLMGVDKLFPRPHHYAYAVGVLGKRN